MRKEIREKDREEHEAWLARNPGMAKEIAVNAYEERLVEHEQKLDTVKHFSQQYKVHEERSKAVDDFETKLMAKDGPKKAAVQARPINLVFTGVEEADAEYKAIEAARAAKKAKKAAKKQLKKNEKKSKLAVRAESGKYLCTDSDQYLLFSQGRRYKVKQGVAFKTIGKAGQYTKLEYCTADPEAPAKTAFAFTRKLVACKEEPKC